MTGPIVLWFTKIYDVMVSVPVELIIFVFFSSNFRENIRITWTAYKIVCVDYFHLITTLSRTKYYLI